MYWRYPKIGQSIVWYEDVFCYVASGVNPNNTDAKVNPKETLQTFVETAINQGYLDYRGSTLDSSYSCHLTIPGHLYLDRLGFQLSDSDQIFVAMWFNNATSPIYEKAMKPAIENAGYKAMRIDEEPHNEKICDQIIAEVRKSKAVIADITCGLATPESWSKKKLVGSPRGGVFYEAGFAHGLGLPVIWTVNQEIADIENVSHFDVRQYNQIRWDVGNLDQARVEIQNRIEATLGRGSVTKVTSQ